MNPEENGSETVVERDLGFLVLLLLAFMFGISWSVMLNKVSENESLTLGLTIFVSIALVACGGILWDNTRRQIAIFCWGTAAFTFVPTVSYMLLTPIT